MRGRRLWRRDNSCTGTPARSEEHTSELQSLRHLVCRLLLEKKTDCVIAEGDPLESRAGGGDEFYDWHNSRRRGSSRTPASFFFFNDTATTGISSLSLHDALPI